MSFQPSLNKERSSNALNKTSFDMSWICFSVFSVTDKTVPQHNSNLHRDADGSVKDRHASS